MWDFLSGIAQWLKDQASVRGKRMEDAVRALQTAAIQTNLYEVARRKRDTRDTGREADLASLWSAAATAFYRLDADLAERLQLKAEYWTDPEAWTSEQVRSARIGLQQITELTRQLLREGGGARRS
jgi:hypothetical protein